MAKEHNAYGPGYRKGQLDHHEWRTAENSAEQLLPTLVAMVAKNPELKFLDVGAGSGTLTASFSKYLPQGHITAVDLSDEILVRAKEYNDEQGVKNVTFQQASVYELPFPDECFDVVHTSQMVVHLDEPQEAIKELVRVCKTGGVISIRDADMRMCLLWPSTPGLDLCLDVWDKFQTTNGGSSIGGRRLISLALETGIKRDQIQLSFHTWCYSTPEERNMWRNVMVNRFASGPMIDCIRKHKLFTEEQMQQVGKAIEDWRRAEDGTFLLPSGAILITK